MGTITGTLGHGEVMRTGSISFYIWKVEKSSYNNPENEIEKEKKKGRLAMILKSFILGDLVSQARR